MSGAVASAGDLVVTTTHVVRDYGAGAGVHGVDLAVPRTGVYGLVGPNGAGKTTLLSMLAGLRRADSGSIWIAPEVDRIAVCPDTPAFEPWLTATEVLGQSRGLARAGRRDIARATDPDVIAHTLAAVGLTEAAKRRVGGFSRGMTQRLGLAAALVLEPQLLLLDEPTSALDPAGRAEILALISRLAADRTVVFSSHLLADVQRVADHIGVLDRGRLLFSGPTQALIEAHTRPAWELRIRGPVTELAARLRGEDWVISVAAGDDGTLRIEGVSSHAGEAGLPTVLAAAGVQLVSVNPVDADLEAAFLALTANHGNQARKVGVDA